MIRVGEMLTNGSTEESPDSSGSRAWYRCGRCHHSMLLDEHSQLEQKESQNEDLLSKDKGIQYTPEKTFSVGDVIYHKEWDDVGLVTEKSKTSDGSSAITVDFQKLGERKLIDSFKPAPDTHNTYEGGES